MFNQLNFIKYIEFNTKADAISTHGSKVGETGQNDTWGKMKQRDFSNDDAIYDVSYSN